VFVLHFLIALRAAALSAALPLFAILHLLLTGGAIITTLAHHIAFLARV